MLVINVKWFLITMGILVFVIFGLILICRFVDRKFMKKKQNFQMVIKTLEQESILDKIRAEIEQLPTTKCTKTYRKYIVADDFKKNVLEIIDKYKAESEG